MMVTKISFQALCSEEVFLLLKEAARLSLPLEIDEQEEDILLFFNEKFDGDLRRCYILESMSLPCQLCIRSTIDADKVPFWYCNGSGKASNDFDSLEAVYHWVVREILG